MRLIWVRSSVYVFLQIHADRMAVFHFIMVIFFLLKWLRNFVINDDIAIWSVIMFIIIIIVIILCRVKIFEWSNFCDNRIIVYAILFKFFLISLQSLFVFQQY